MIVRIYILIAIEALLFGGNALSIDLPKEGKVPGVAAVLPPAKNPEQGPASPAGATGRADSAANGTPPSSPSTPPANIFGEVPVRVGDQQIKGWEEDPILIRNQIQQSIQRMNANIENWDRREGSSYAEGFRHQGVGSMPNYDVGPAPEQPTLLDAIKAAGLPERGFVFKRIPQQDGTTSFDIYAWPSNDPTSPALLEQAGKMLAQREQQLRAMGAGSSGDSSSGVSGVQSNSSNGSVNTDINVSLPPQWASKLSEIEVKKESAPEDKTKEKAKSKAYPGKGDLLAGLKEGFKLGKELGSALAKSENANGAKPSPLLKAIEADLSQGAYRVSVPASSPSRGIASTASSEDLVAPSEGSVLDRPHVATAPMEMWRLGRFLALAGMTLAVMLIVYSLTMHKSIKRATEAPVDKTRVAGHRKHKHKKDQSREVTQPAAPTAVTVLDRSKRN